MSNTLLHFYNPFHFEDYGIVMAYCTPCPCDLLAALCKKYGSSSYICRNEEGSYYNGCLHIQCRASSKITRAERCKVFGRKYSLLLWSVLKGTLNFFYSFLSGQSNYDTLVYWVSVMNSSSRLCYSGIMVKQ